MKKPKKKTVACPRSPSKTDPNRYPKGWDRKRVEAVIAHYEKQTDEEAMLEDEAAYESATSTMIQVPLALVPQVERLIARRAG